MSGRDWRIFAMLVGWLAITGQAPNEVARPQQPSAQERTASAAESIAARYNEQTERANGSRETEPCEQGEDKRYSDLCAQWKAADSAQLAAWLNLASLAAVLVALWLAFHSNWIARDTARRQLRAYMGVQACEMAFLDEGKGFILTAILENAGQTPAYEARIMGITFVAEYPLFVERPFGKVAEGYSAPIAPGHTIGGAYRLLTDDVPEALRRAKAGDIGLYIQGICEYRDVFGTKRETKFRYVFGGRIANAGGLVLHAAETGNSAT